jgi:hypothetical protein
VADGDQGPGFLAWLRAHPILCLAILTPGIPEYLSTSSPVLGIVEDPAFFALQLAINLAQYTAGALLIREALIRWRKGWATGIALGLAYGVAEEGIGDNTLFNNTHGADGFLGTYGHFLGVNWVWSVGVLASHVIYSTGLPIVLLGLALPQTRGRSLLSRRGIVVCLLAVASAAGVEMAIVWGAFHFWLGWPLLLGALLTIGALILAGRRAPAMLLAPRADLPTLGPWAAFLLGFAFFPVAFILEYGVGIFVPAVAIIAAELVVFAALLEAFRRGIGRRSNEFVWVQLAFGFVLWQGIFGWLVTFGLPYQLPLVAVAIYFFVRLRRAYRPAPRGDPPAGLPPVPAGATASPPTAVP